VPPAAVPPAPAAPPLLLEPAVYDELRRLAGVMTTVRGRTEWPRAIRYQAAEPAARAASSSGAADFNRVRETPK